MCHTCHAAYDTCQLRVTRCTSQHTLSRHFCFSPTHITWQICSPVIVDTRIHCCAGFRYTPCCGRAHFTSKTANCMRSMMKGIVLICLAAAVLISRRVTAQADPAAAEDRLTYYNVVWPASGPTSGPSTATATSFPKTADQETCVRYMFTCTEGDSSC
jgi:hypothetical protein